jgi:hypothetical protein
MCVQITPFLRLSGLLALKYKQNPRLLVSKEKVANKMKSEHGWSVSKALAVAQVMQFSACMWCVCFSFFPNCILIIWYASLLTVYTFLFCRNSFMPHLITCMDVSTQIVGWHCYSSLVQKKEKSGCRPAMRVSIKYNIYYKNI